jgi:uncharacterized protein YhjY with autotransporter beta-barrel domain
MGRPDRVLALRAMLAASAIILATVAPAGAQQTFNDANTNQLRTNICNTPGLGPNLGALCGRGGAGSAVTGPGVLSAVSPSTAERHMLEAKAIADAEETPSGGSADVQRVRLFGDTTLALSAGADSVVQALNPFETPYHATASQVTAAIGTHPVSWLTYGLGFTYQHVAGDFQDFGDFRVDTYQPFLFASVTPIDGVFIDATLAYSSIGNTRNRAATATASNGNALQSGIASGAPGENGYTGAILFGYDKQFGNFTVGPRVGFNAGYWNIDGYQESGTTGLELRYQSMDQTSLHSTLGAAASVVVPTTFGAVLSTVTASWVHEFEAYPRLIYAQFAEAPNSSIFTFSSQKPAADFGILGITVSAALPGGARPYASFGTLLGNGVYQSYGGMVGVTFHL